MVKDKDPSDIMNDVNGFDIITCKGMQEVQIILVIPNIGYGFLSTMCARMTRGKGTSTPGPSMSYKITPGSESAHSTESLHIITSGKELFVPSSGMDARMFTSRCNMNDVCSTGGELANNIILPIPLKVSLSEPNDFSTSLETKSYMSSAQEALFRAMLDICNSMSVSGPFEDTIQASAAAQIIRSFSTTLQSESKNQWTGDVASETERVEYMHLGSAEPGELGSVATWVARTLESWDRKVQKTNVPPESTDLFIRPFAAVLAPSPDGKGRLYYSPELTEKLFRMEVHGVHSPPKVICEDILYLLDPEDNQSSSPSWGTVVGSSSIESSLGIGYEDYWIVSSEMGRVNYVFNKDQIYNISSIKTWSPSFTEERTNTARLYTFRPPVFTSGGIVVDTTESDDVYRLLFSSAYYYPTATAEIISSVYSSCTRCAGLGTIGSVTCVNCKGMGIVPCFNCAGKDLQYNELTNSMTESTGYITDSDTQERLYCKYCNPAPGESPEDENIYANAPGMLKDTYCNGTGIWEQSTCPACDGSKVSYSSKESTIGTNDMVLVYDGAGNMVRDDILDLYDSRNAIVQSVNPGTYHIEIPIDVPKVDGVEVDWIPESYTVEIMDSTTEKTAVLSPTQESPVNPGLALDIFTYTKNIQLQITMPLENIMATQGPFNIKVYAVKDSPTDFGYSWSTTELGIPVRTIGPDILKSKEDIYRIMYKDPREVNDISWESGVDYELEDIRAYGGKLYECTTGHTSSSFAADIDNWNMISYSPDPEEIPMREGFGHLACSIDHFLDIIGSTGTLKHTSCYRKHDTKSINDDLQEIELCPSKISNGSPLKVYTSTIKNGLSSFVSDRPTGNEDELFLSSRDPGSKILRTDVHKKVWSNKLPSGMSGLEVWEETLEALSEVNPAIVDLYEEKIYPYGMRKTAKYIIGPKTPSVKANISDSKEIPVGSYGAITRNEMAPMDIPSSTNVTTSGVVNIPNLLSSASSIAGSLENVSVIKSLIESVPVIADKVITMSDDILVEVDPTSTEPIIRPEPLFVYDYVTSGEVPPDKLYISVDKSDNVELSKYLGIVRDVLSSSSGSTLPPTAQEINTRFKQGMLGLNEIITGDAKSSWSTQASSSSLCEALSYCHRIIDSLESKVIVDTEYGSECTIFVVRTTDNSNTVLAIPREYTNKGLWYYNLRKTYYVLKSSINLCKAIIEKAYSMLTGVRVGYSQAPFSQTGYPVENGGYDNITYHEMDLSVFKGEDGSDVYPAIMGEDSWPAYASSEEWGEEYGIIDLSSITNQVNLNTIGQYFSPGSIGYSMTVDFSGYGELSQENDPLFLMGMGTGSTNSTLGVSEQVPYVNRTMIHAVDSEGIGWHTLSEITDSDIYEKVKAIQDATGSKDHLKREGSGIVGYITPSGTKGTISYISLADMRSKLINGNLSEIIPFMGKPPLKCTIDMSYIFPYLSDYYESMEYQLSLRIDFKTDEPKYIQDISGSLTTDITELTKTSLKDFFKCTSEETSSTYIETSSIFTDWDAEKKRLDSVVDDLVYTLNQGSWLTNLVRDPTIPYQVSFSGFTDPTLRNLVGIGTCLLIRYLMEYELSRILYSDDMLAQLMAVDNWNHRASKSTWNMNYNYNLLLSKRRAFIVAKYIVGTLMLRSMPNTEKGMQDVSCTNKDWYRTIIVESPSSPAEIGSPVTTLPSEYSEYETGWSLAYKCRAFKSYGFGDLASNATVQGKEAMGPQRTVIVSAPNPGEYSKGATLKSGDYMKCILPIGNEHRESTTLPNVELSRKSIYYPEAEVLDSDTRTKVKWTTNPTYVGSSLEDTFDKNGNVYERVGSSVTTISRIFRELGDHMGGGVPSSEIDDMVAHLAHTDFIREKVVRYAEEFVAKCFVKDIAGTVDSGYTTYGKAFHAHGTCLDNIWLLVLRKD